MLSTFACWLSICLLWEDVYLDPLPFKKIVCLFVSGYLLLSCMNSFFILDINPLWIGLGNVFSHSVDCFFILVMISFVVQKIFSLM